MALSVQVRFFADYHKASDHKAFDHTDYNTVAEHLYYYMDKPVDFSF